MKAKCLGTKQVELKPGDKVTVYVTTTWGTTSAPWGASTALKGSGVVVRVYRHIDAVVVRFARGGIAAPRTRFIRDSDSRYSVWRDS